MEQYNEIIARARKEKSEMNPEVWKGVTYMDFTNPIFPMVDDRLRAFKTIVASMEGVSVLKKEFSEVPPKIDLTNELVPRYVGYL